MKSRYGRAGMKVFAGMMLLGLCFGCGQRDDAQQESEELAYQSDAEPASDSVATDSGDTLSGDAEGKTDTAQKKLPLMRRKDSPGKRR